MHRRPSLADVAQRAGISKSAVSQILNHYPGARISPAARERVAQAVAELGYQPNRIAVSLVRGRTATIGVMVPDLTVLFYAGIVDGIESAASGADYRIILAHSRSDPANEMTQIDMLHDQRVDGIIAMSVNSHRGGGSQWLAPDQHHRIPCVLIDESKPEIPVDTVTSDDRIGTRLAVEHLIERGHRRIGFIGAGSPRSTACDRLDGYRDALTQAHILRQENWELGCGYDPALVPGLLIPLLKSAARPTALVAANDYLAMAAIDVARELGLRIGDDLALVGYSNDCHLAHALRLTSVDQSLGDLGRSAVACLLKRLADPSGKPQSIVVPTALVVRQSSGPPASPASRRF